MSDLKEALSSLERINSEYEMMYDFIRTTFQ